MAQRKQTPGGIIHTYQKYDPTKFPSPKAPPPDLVSPAMEHWLMYGDQFELTPEQLANAVKIDPSQISGLGPSIDSLIKMLEERKRKILETYETDAAQKAAKKAYRDHGEPLQPPKRQRERFQLGFEQEQLYDLERVWYALDDERSTFGRDLVMLIEHLSRKYEVDQLVAKYDFTGRETMTVDKAIEVKEELEKIDELLEQLKQARENAQIGIIDMEQLSEYADPGEMEQLMQLQRQVEQYLREQAEQQGLTNQSGNVHLSPQAYKIFQGKLLERIFSNLQASRSGRHQGPIVGEGAVELQATKDYEFGDSLTNMDIPQTLINAMLRQGNERPLQMRSEDIVIHKTKNNPKCATCVIMDMSGSMRYDAQYANVKRMALAMQGLIRSEFPGDFLQMIEMYSFAKPVAPGEVIGLLPKPVTIHDPVVRLRADMSKPEVSEYRIPPHFTNIQHALQQARLFLATQDTPNRQIILITDGLPTAHFEGSELFLLYPPDPRTEAATMREGKLCEQEGITINMFLIPSWSQSEEDIRFAYRLAESTKGRVFFTAGNDLDRYVVWDYINRKREVLG
ncbi:VWA domain-containing protein [Bremerella sp. T1]|uniref:VWA domain-containing protein n=1 Tax=Bremerella sp. TYQ1 TaxID=3119568 RepID=UPI001CCC7C99|nr:VWA domain-containing protein [Bremerella volcania]UBM38136.1 VWA domain-containing protein [Bremerella volcania]